MYPVRLGFLTAKKRINKLVKNKHHAEALLTSVFTFEKIIHRTLKQLIISSSFRSTDAEKLLSQMQGFNKKKEIWQCFDPENKNLAEIIGNDCWQHIGKAVKMRNRLVHGKQSYSLEECKTMTSSVMSLLERTVAVFNEQYGYDGWSNISTRKVAKLHVDPKVGRSIQTSS